ETLKRIIKNLTSNFKNSIGTPISYVKDSYYRIIQHIMNHGSIRNTFHKKEICFRKILESILECNNLFDLENIVLRFIDDIALMLNDSSKKNSTVPSILEYIHKNYSNTNLCLDDISKNTYLTPTYICVIFKDQMYKTVNKYITEYRIEKAKAFLKDSNIKMSDIAGKVGYNDPNYFSKIFRKETSYTPSEYRRYFTSEI
ncbi:helix-turn-helix transcriptional regulator, partial [Clostridium butyricum]